MTIHFHIICMSFQCDLLRLRYNLGSGLTIRILVKLKINYGDLSLKLVNMIEQGDGGKFVEGCQLIEKDTNNLDT